MRVGLKGLVAGLLVFSHAVYATDYADDEDVAAESAEDVTVGIDTKDEKQRFAPSRQIFRHALDNAPPFFKDTKGSFKIRTFDLARATKATRLFAMRSPPALNSPLSPANGGTNSLTS